MKTTSASSNPPSHSDLMDLEPLSRLKESLETARSNTSSMLWKLSDFESRLSRLDKKMLPIQTSTSQLSAAKSNIGLTISEIEKTNEYFRLARENSGIINKGLRGHNSTVFFEAVERISIAKRYFDQHRDMKSAKDAIESIDTMLKKAIGLCLEEAGVIYRSCGKCIELDDSGTLRPVNSLADNMAALLKMIADCLESQKVTQHLAMYLSHRSIIIRGELKNYEESTSSLASAGASSPHSHSPTITLLDFITDGSVLYTKGNLFFPKYYFVAFTMLRGELLLWSSSLPHGTGAYDVEVSAVFTSICELVIGEISRCTAPYTQTDGSTMTVPGAAKKKSAANAVIMQRKNNLFLIRLDLLDILLSKFLELRDLCNPDEDNTTQQKINDAITALYNYRDNVARSCVAACDDVLKAVRLTQQTGLSSSGTSNSAMAVADISCELHPISGYVLCFCKEVVAFETVYQDLLEIADEISCPAQHLPPSTVAMESIVLEGLIMRLQERKSTVISRSVSSASNASQRPAFVDGSSVDNLQDAKKHVFMLNNLDVIAVHLRGRIGTMQPGGAAGGTSGSRKEGRVSMLRNYSMHHNRASTGGSSLAHQSSSGSISGDANLSPVAMLTNLYHTIEGRIQNELNDLCNVISTLLLNCLSLKDAEEVAIAKNSSNFTFAQSIKSNADLLLSKKLKLCFGAFNAALDGIVTMNDHWRISSKELRDRVHTQLNIQVLDAYSDFYGAHSTVNFSKKNKESYLRYPPAQVERVLTEIFS